MFKNVCKSINSYYFYVTIYANYHLIYENYYFSNFCHLFDIS